MTETTSSSPTPKSPTGLPMVDATCDFTHRGYEAPCSARGTYRMVGSCANCMAEVAGVFTLGHEARSGWNSPDCPVCACKGHLHWKRIEDDPNPNPDPATHVVTNKRDRSWIEFDVGLSGPSEGEGP